MRIRRIIIGMILCAGVNSYADEPGIFFRYVEGGRFEMGDDSGELWEETVPVHTVTLDYDFYVSKTEVTYELYDLFCETTGRDEIGGRDLKPVMNVSWFDAIAFCNWLSKMKHIPPAYDEQTGGLLNLRGELTDDITETVGFRLLTEAEWEYTARGGVYDIAGAYSGSDWADDVSWYGMNSMKSPQDVMLLEPNELGIYDMSGNAWEWCTDRYKPYEASESVNPVVQGPNDYKIIRGGAYTGSETRTMVADRDYRVPDMGYDNIGFRLAITDTELIEQIIE